MPDKHEPILSFEAPPPPPTGDDYRDLAGKIRDVAREARWPVARRELVRLATNYDRRADQIDQRTYSWRSVGDASA